MWASPQIFRDIISPCAVCRMPFDGKMRSPQILQCAHTFCHMCLSTDDQVKKRKCFECKINYTKYSLNTLLLDAVKRLEERRKWFDAQLFRCDECDLRVPIGMMRRCSTCEDILNKRTNFGYRIECVMCLECCVNSHNGHEVRKLSSRFVVDRVSSLSISRLTTFILSSKRRRKLRSSSSSSSSSSSDFSQCQVDVRQSLTRSQSFAKRMKARIRGVFSRMSIKGLSSVASFKILARRPHLPISAPLFDESQIVEQRLCSFYETQDSRSWISNFTKGMPTQSTLSSDVFFAPLPEHIEGNFSPSLFTDEFSMKDTISVDSVFESHSADVMDFETKGNCKAEYVTEDANPVMVNFRPKTECWRIRLGVACTIQPSLRMKQVYPYLENMTQLYGGAADESSKPAERPPRPRETKSDSAFNHRVDPI